MYRLLLLISAASLSVIAARASPAEARRPNVVVFIADDVSWNDFGCYGSSSARTPNIDALAAGGLRFVNAFLTASSCSPSRSSIITGRYPHNNGAACELHQPISGHIPWFPEILRESGYYTALSGKNHMTSAADEAGSVRRPAFEHIDGGRVPGNSGGHANWVSVLRDRPKDRPFFCWFASYDAHRGWDGDNQWDEARYGPMHTPQSVTVPPFLIDNEATRQDLASYCNEVTRFDFYIGEVMAELRAQGEADDTLVFVLADNGRPFPRAKTRLHDSGMKTALVAHWPSGISASSDSAAMVSVIDLAPTILQATECDVPDTVQGVSLLPVFADPNAVVRDYVFSEHNWHDYEAHGRSVRAGNYLLIRNSRPDYAWQGPADSVRSPSHQSLLTASESSELSVAQGDVLLAPRPKLELYDTAADPLQLHNLAGEESHRQTEAALLAVLTEWAQRTGDSVPDRISPDTFDRRTGERLPKSAVQREGVLVPGEDRQADRINDSGPVRSSVRERS